MKTETLLTYSEVKSIINNIDNRKEEIIAAIKKFKKETKGRFRKTQINDVYVELNIKDGNINIDCTATTDFNIAEIVGIFTFDYYDLFEKSIEEIVTNGFNNLKNTVKEDYKTAIFDLFEV